MILEKLQIENFRGIESLTFEPKSQVSLLCGINGAGKSTILDAISLHLSWIISRLRQSNASGKPILPHDINNHSNFAQITSTFVLDSKKYSAVLSKSKPGKSTVAKSDMKDISDLAHYFREQITVNEQEVCLPVFVHYNVDRAVTDIPLRIKKQHAFDLLSTYENSLNSGVAFRSFFEWFRNREDIENENYRMFAEKNHPALFNLENSQKQLNLFESDPQLLAVRKVVELLTGFTNLTIKRSPLQMQVTKAGEALQIDQLSAGEKSLIALAGDLARRLAIANPKLENPLEGNGIVLIDEIELHLHPKWQKEVIGKFCLTFPNIQFILTTHSPQVLSEVQGNSVFLLYNEEGIIKITNALQAKGLSSNEILEEIMGTEPLSAQVKEKLDQIFTQIDKEDTGKAKILIQEFIDTYGSVPEIIRAETLLSFFNEVAN